MTDAEYLRSRGWKFSKKFFVEPLCIDPQTGDQYGPRVACNIQRERDAERLHRALEACRAALPIVQESIEWNSHYDELAEGAARIVEAAINDVLKG